MKYNIALVAACLLALGLSFALATEHNRVKSKVIGATAVCKDGAITTVARGTRGICSGHGGVKEWLN